jgi:hypothetical protein
MDRNLRFDLLQDIIVEHRLTHRQLADAVGVAVKTVDNWCGNGMQHVIPERVVTGLVERYPTRFNRISALTT